MNDREAFDVWALSPGPDEWWGLSERERLFLAWQAATDAAQAEIDELQAQLVRQQVSYEAEIKVEIDAALERAAVVRMKLPPPKYGENASPIQAVYQDAFDRGWKAGIAAMRSAIRALKEE